MKTSKRILAVILTLCMMIPVVSLLPFQTVAAADTGNSSSPVSAETYSELGFNTMSENEYPTNDTLNRKYSVSSIQNELYVHVNADEHYGTILRDNLNFFNAGEFEHDSNGAIKTYGDLTASLSYGRGNSYSFLDVGRTDVEHTLYSSFLQGSDKMESKAYATSTALRSLSGVGTDDMVATLEVLTNTSSGNRPSFSISLTLETFKGKTRVRSKSTSVASRISPSSMTNVNTTLDFQNLEYDALIEITAGDYNGDGKDEIAVYYGAGVIKVYKINSDNSVTPMSTIDQNLLGSYSFDAPGITMSSGDMDGDGKEELAVALSHHKNADGRDILGNSYVYIFSCSGSQFSEVFNSTLNKDSAGIVRDANVYMADATGDGKAELFVAGHLLAPKMNSNGTTTFDYNPTKPYKQFAVFSVSCLNGNYTENAFQVFSSFGGENGTNLSKEQNGYGRYGAPIGLGVANFDKQGSTDKMYAFIDEQLYQISPTGLSYTLINNSALTYTDDPYTRSNGDTDKRDRWVSSVTVGNFSGNENGRQQILVVTGLRAKGNQQKYWYQLSWYSLDNGTLTRGHEMIMASSLSYNISSDKRNNSCFVAIAAPDVNDDDTLILERIGDVQRYYTKPSINSIIQAAPYFEDLSSDSYPNNGGTEFGSSTGSTQSGLASCGVAAGIKGEVEAEAGIAVDVELEASFAFDYNFEHTWENETSVTFGGGTDDYVIMYTVPYSVYTYRMLVSPSKKAVVPGTTRYNRTPNYSDALVKAKSEMDLYDDEEFISYAAWVELNTDYLNMTPQQIWERYKPGSAAPKSYFYVEIEEPCSPVTTILTVDQYDEIASRTDGLETIRGTYLNSTPGDPSSYSNIPTSYYGIKRVDEFRQVGNAEGGYISVEYSVGTEESHSFEFGLEFQSSCTVGGGLLGCKVVAGLTGSLSGGGGYAYSDSVGNTYSGTVDSLPKDATDYDFYWQLCKATARINGKEVDIVYYDVKDVRSLPKTPQNLTVSDVSADSVTLTWDNNSSASRFEVYAVNNNSQSLFLDTVTAGTSSDSLTYESTGLSSGTDYSYKIRAVNNSGLKSRFSSVVSATTLPDNGGSFGISQQPEDFETFAGDVAIFTVVAYTTNNKPIQYQWQTYDEDSRTWVDLDGKRSATLKVDATPEKDGSRYRCVVYQGAGCIVYSSAVELIIGKTGSNTKLTVANNSADNTIPDGSTVYCSGEIQQAEVTPVNEWVADIRTVGTNNYTKLAYVETEDADGNPVYEGPFVFVSDEGKYYSVTDEDEIGEEIAQQAGFYNGAENFLLNKDGSAVTHTGYYEQNVENSEVSEEVTIGDKTYTFTTEIAEVTYEDTDDNASYTVYSFDDTTDEEATERRVFYKFECEGEPVWKELDLDETNSYDTVIINQDGADRATEDYKTVQVYKQVGTNTIIRETPVEGDTLYLTASSRSATTNDELTFDSYSFVIRDAATGNVVFSNTVPVNNTQYTFTEPGVYEITVTASGDDNYKASTSEKTIIYVVNNPDIGSDDMLVISGSTIKYGESLDLNPVIITGNSGSSARNVEYTVVCGENAVTGLIDNDTFTPDKAGNYIITAECGDLTTAASVNVDKRDLKVSVLNCEAPCNASEPDKISLISYDVEGDIDGIWNDEAVIATSDAFTATTAERYQINLTVNTDSSVYEELDSKYNIRLNGATYTLTASAFKVTVETENKGTSDISYIVEGADEPSFASSGDYIASGADVTVTALPYNGYVFKGWMKNGENISVNAVYEIHSISEDANLKAAFEPVEHSKYYTVDYGTLIVGYTSNEIHANPTVTGDKVLVKDSDYVITYYAIDENGVIAQRCDTPVNIGSYLFVMSAVGSEISSAYGFEGGVPETITGENADEFIATYKCANILTIVDSSGAHVHSYTARVTTEPTCTKTGVKTFTCECGESYTEDVPALGHTYGEWTDVISDTCGGDSYSVRTCSVCQAEETINVHPESHAWDTKYTVDKEATCTEDGSKSIHCTKCDATQFSTVIPALGHSYGEWTDVVSDTCGGDSYSVRTCSVCQAEETVNLHAESHAWATEYTVDKEPTCTENGSKSIHCTKCDATQYSTTIPALGHSYGEWTDVVSDVCGGNSYSVRICSVCQAEESTNIHPEGHAWATEYTVDKEPSCTEAGSKSIHCTKCDATQYSTAIPALGHSFGEWTNVVADTCGGDSYSTRSCSACGFEETINIHPESHAWDTEYTVDKEATCTEDGSKSIHCTKCDATQYNEVIPAKGHTPGEWEVETPATQDRNGTEVRKCTECGEVVDSRETVVHSHVFSYKITTPATCVDDGVITFTCSCGESYTVSQYALGHIDDNNDGKCDRCGFVMNESIVALEAMVINVPENTKVEWKQSTTVVVTASAVPADCELVLYYGDTRIAKKPDANGDVTIEQDLGKVQKNTEISVVAEKNGYVQSNSNGLLKKDFTVSVKTSFFDKLISFFKRLFALLKPVVIRPGN